MRGISRPITSAHNILNARTTRAGTGSSPVIRDPKEATSHGRSPVFGDADRVYRRGERSRSPQLRQGDHHGRGGGRPAGRAWRSSSPRRRSLGKKPSVIWLHFQECTGCTESLLRTSHPALDELILDLISLDYHETLLVAARASSGRGAPPRRRWKPTRASTSCVVEGAIPTKDGGIYCKIGGRTAIEIAERGRREGRRDHRHRLLRLVGRHPSADPNPTGAVGRAEILKGKTVVTIPGCPANPYNFLGTVLQYATLGTLPGARRARPAEVRLRPHHPRALPAPRALRRRPLRAASSATRGTARASASTSSAARARRPTPTARCSHFGEVVGAWPIGIGHPCFGCTEQALAFRVPLHDTVPIERPTPPDTYPPIHAEQGNVSPVATGVAGLVGGAVVGAGLDGRQEARRATQPKPKN